MKIIKKLSYPFSQKVYTDTINELIDAANQGEEPDEVSEDKIEVMLDSECQIIRVNQTHPEGEDLICLTKEDAEELLPKITRLIKIMDPDF